MGGDRRVWGIAWPALALCAVLSAPWLANPMFLDDWHVLYTAQRAPWTVEGLARGFTFLDRSSIETWNLPPSPAYHFFRPLVVAAFKAELALWGTWPVGYHAVALAAHLLSTLLVAAIALRLSADAKVARLAALLFAIQPQITVAIVWTSGHTEALAAVWILGGLWCYLVARQRRRPVWLAGTAAAFALACLTKENAVLLPAAIVAYEGVAWWAARAGVELPGAGGEGAGAARAAVLSAGPFVVAGLAFVGFRLMVFDAGAELVPPYYHDPLGPGFVGHAVAKTACNVVALASTALLVPLFGVAWLLEHPAALALLVLAAAGVLAALLRGGARRPPVLFGAALLALALLPTLPILTTDLYLYLPAAGFALLAAPWLARRRRVIVVGYLALFALGFTARGALYRVEGHVSERIHDDIAADLGELPAGGVHLLLVDMPIAASHVAPMLRLRTGRDDVRATLVNVSTQWTTPTRESRVTCEGPSQVRVRPPTGLDALFETAEEWNLQLFHQPIEPGRRYTTDGFAVTPVGEGGRIVALELTFEPPLPENPARIYAFWDDGETLAHRQCR